MSMTIEQITSALLNVAKLETKAGQELLAQMLEQMQGLRAERDTLKELVVNLAVENGAMKFAIEFATAPDMWLEDADGMYDYKYCEWYVDVLNEAATTPATDDALANIQAQGAEMYAEHLTRKAIESGENKNHAYAYLAANFAAQLRKGAAV